MTALLSMRLRLEVPSDYISDRDPDPQLETNTVIHQILTEMNVAIVADMAESTAVTDPTLLDHGVGEPFPLVQEAVVRGRR